MSAMSAHFTAAPAAARPTAAIRRASRRSAARVVRRGVVAEAIKEPSTLNTTKSDQVRTTSRPLLMCAFERGRFTALETRRDGPRRASATQSAFRDSQSGYDTISGNQQPRSTTATRARA